MAINVVPAYCPQCGAALNQNPEINQLFCVYCGSKLIIQNDNEQIYRHIDDAEVKRADTERIVQLRQIEIDERQAEANRMIEMRRLAMEEQRFAQEQREKRTKIMWSLIIAGAGFLMSIVLPFIGLFPLGFGIVKLIRTMNKYR